MIQVRVPIIERVESPGGNFIVTIEAPQIARASRPGQFVMVAPAIEDPVPAPLLKRALAVYDVFGPKETQVRLLLKTVGEGTSKICAQSRGRFLEIVGPLGNGFDLQAARGRINLLIAGGTGIASVFLLAKQLVRSGEEVHLLYGGRSADDLIGLKDFADLEIPVLTTTEDGTHGDQGLVTQRLETHLETLPSDLVNFYICGPMAMMEATTRIAAKRDIPSQLSVEVKMGCGFGVCLGCTVKSEEGYRLACTDGPVFDAHRFIWEPSGGKHDDSPRLVR